MTAFYLLLSLSLALVRIVVAIGGRRGVHLGDRALRVLRAQASAFPLVQLASTVEGTVNRVELADAITKARGQLDSVTCGAIAEGSLAFARDASDAALADYIADTVEKVDLVIETDGSRHVRAWLYDHGVEGIACAATIDDYEHRAGGILEPTVRALHAVATDAD